MAIVEQQGIPFGNPDTVIIVRDAFGEDRKLVLDGLETLSLCDELNEMLYGDPPKTGVKENAHAKAS